MQYRIKYYYLQLIKENISYFKKYTYEPICSRKYPTKIYYLKGRGWEGPLSNYFALLVYTFWGIKGSSWWEVKGERGSRASSFYFKYSLTLAHWW